ncbi:HET domain containing protein [Hyaloscypha variabilis]
MALIVKKKEGTCSHDVTCSDCKRVVNWLLHDTEKNCSPPRNIRCGECHREYQCQYCLSLASKLRLIFYGKNGGHYNHGNVVVEVEPFVARVLRHRFPEEVSKGLRIGLVSGYYGPMALDGVWLTAFEKGSHTAPGLITTHNSWTFKIDKLRILLERCEKSHGMCKRQDIRHVSPGEDLYLLDLHDRRLVLSTIDTAPYVCLSYVWGKMENILDCRKSRLEPLMKEGALDNPDIFNPPLTVRSTMEFVKSMGERYLWVDRYCIVQDDHDYKEAQLKRMCQIYASARYTIIAADGTAADGLTSWDSETDRSRQHNNLWYSNETHSILAGVGLEENPFENGTWDSRGWTFQEKLFSLKTIIFNNGMVFWRCHEQFWQQDFLHSSNTHWRVFQPLVPPPWPSLIYLGCLALKFAKRELTFPSDCIAAFSGILIYLEPHFPGGFLFGMPELWFDIALLWEPGDRFLEDRFQQDEIACIPSWSWARWKGNINFHAWEMATQYVVVDENMCPKLFDGPIFSNVPEESKEVMRRLTDPDIGLSLTTPIVKWYRRSNSPTQPASRDRPILNCYNDFKYETNIDADPPPPWIRCHTTDGYVYKIKDPIHHESPLYKCPIYSSDVISTIPKDETIPSTIIYGRVKIRFLRLGASSGIRMKDIRSVNEYPSVKPNFQLLSLDKKVQIGTLTVNVVNQEAVNEISAISKTIAARLGFQIDDNHSVIEVIVISAGECSCNEESGGTMYFELYQWETDRGKDSLDEVYCYYNVMFIRRRKDNVAERMGIGRAARDLWDEEGDEEIGVELG